MGTLLWPALLADPIAEIAMYLATSTEPSCESAPSEADTRTEPLPEAASTPSALTLEVSRKAALYQTYLGALIGRLMNPGGWVAGARRAGAEPLWTGRRRPYDESTLRKQARKMVVRRDTAVARGGPRGSAAPEEVIFPAHPGKGQASTKALRYRTGTPLPKAELRRMDRVYKTRWPFNENAIKDLVAVGFDRNLDRGLTRTTSRGIDGELGRVEAREQALITKVEAFKPTTFAQSLAGIRRPASSLVSGGSAPSRCRK